MHRAASLLVAVGLPGALLLAGAHRAHPPAAPTTPSVPAAVVPNDNRVAGGRRVGDVVALDLVAGWAAWRPDLDVDSAVTVRAFSEAGGAPRIPGPLLRAASGTEVRVRLRNATGDSTLVVRGLRAGTVKDDTLHVAPGATREVRFTLGAPGTYLYWGSTTPVTGRRFATRHRDSQLTGAIVVDARGARPDPRERVFVMTVIDMVPDSAKGLREDIWELAINGRSWPHSEQLRYAVGDTVRWRWLNASYLPHPMHLHGFHFRTTARGDGSTDTTYAAGEVRDVVTEFAFPGATFRMEWVPTRAGQWLMHCHMAPHMVPFPERPDSVRAHDAHDVASHPRSAMAGLVLGITTEERRGRPRPVATDVAAARRLRLFVQERRPDSAGRPPRRAYVLQEGEPPRADSVVAPGTPLLLVRGERTAVTVINRLREPTTVHWHGMELESVYDGVAGWSGARGSLAPLVAPGDSFAVAFTPPRAGTFMYHTHMDEGAQLRTGLYGPMLVLEPGERFDPATDHVLMVGRATERGRNVFAVNGRGSPDTLVLRAGAVHRLRLANILPAAPVRAELRADTTLLAWRALAKDGATLPRALQRDASARQWMGVGETYDFTWAPARPMTATLTFVLPEEEAGRPLVVPVRVIP